MATLAQVVATGREINAAFWDGFTPFAPEELRRVQEELRIKIPADLIEFYLEVGWGQTPDHEWGGIDGCDDLIAGCAIPISYMTGSRWPPGEEWATEEEHRQFWITRGEDNPNPEKFTPELMKLDGVPLWDLLQVGGDGSCGLHHVYVGDGEPRYRYAMLHQAQLLEVADSFLEGFHRCLLESLEVEDEG